LIALVATAFFLLAIYLPLVPCSSPRPSRLARQAVAGMDLQVQKDAIYEKVPHTFVFRRGSVSARLQTLVRDLRNVLMPYTAKNLKERRKNRIRDFIAAAGHLKVTHLLVLSESPAGGYLRMIRTPKGPTFTFKLTNYELMQEVIDKQQRRPSWKPATSKPAVFVARGLNSTKPHHKLASALFQGVFPALSVEEASTRDLKRMVYMWYNASCDTFEFRHFSSKISSIMPGDDVEKLQAEYLLDNKSFSCASVVEDRKLVVWEVGPRITMELIRIDEGLPDMKGSGSLIYYKPPPNGTKLSSKKRLRSEKKEERTKLKNRVKEMIRKRKFKPKLRRESVMSNPEILRKAAAEAMSIAKLIIVQNRGYSVNNSAPFPQNN